MSKNDCVSHEDASRYAESIRQYLNELYNDGRLEISDADWRVLMEIILRVGDIPAADVKPVAKGKWVHGREISRQMLGDAIISIRYENWYCSECGCVVKIPQKPKYRFCPNCGADMREEANNE